MPKTEVYRWRLDADLKRRLEDAARARKTRVGRLLDRMAREWLERQPRDENDEALQRRLRAEFMKVVGTISSGDPYPSKQVKQRVRAKLRAKHERLQLHTEAEDWIGSLSLGEGPYTRKRIRERVRARLTEKRRRSPRDAPAGSGFDRATGGSC